MKKLLTTLAVLAISTFTWAEPIVELTNYPTVAQVGQTYNMTGVYQDLAVTDELMLCLEGSNGVDYVHISLPFKVTPGLHSISGDVLVPFPQSTQETFESLTFVWQWQAKDDGVPYVIDEIPVDVLWVDLPVTEPTLEELIGELVDQFGVDVVLTEVIDQKIVDVIESQE